MTRIQNSLDQNSEVDHVLEVSKSTMVMVISNSAKNSTFKMEN